MTRPREYDPRPDCRYQIFCRYIDCGPAWEHCDYATDPPDKTHLLKNYREAFGAGWNFKVIQLPRKYWPEQPRWTTPAHPTPETTP
jgi:hypothetical protein